jgi:hypothetical protein
MKGFYVTDEAPGAVPNGTVMEKINSEHDDAHPDGAQCVVIGSISDTQRGYGYFVVWDDTPDTAVFITGTRLKEVRGSGLLPLHDHCVICQNEGQHEAGRPHVMEGQE